MKKIALLLALLIGMSFIPAVAGAVGIPVRVVVNEIRLNFPDAQPFVDSNNRIQVPASVIGEALGVTSIIWDGKAKKAVLEAPARKMIIYIGKKEYEINGTKMQMDTAAMLKQGRVYVPVGYMGEAFGATVEWDSDSKTVYIYTGKYAGNEGKPGETENLAGFIVPKDTELLAFPATGYDKTEVGFEVNLLGDNPEKQIKDLESILLQKCDKSTVDAVISHIRQKKERFDFLPHKYFYDKKSKRYIWVDESYSEDIGVYYCKAGFKLDKDK